MPKEIIWFMDGQRLIEVALLGSILLEAALINLIYKNSVPTNQLTIQNNMRYAFLLLLVLAITSAYLAQSPRLAVIEIATFIGLSYLAIFVAREFLTDKEILLKRLTYGLWISVLLYMVSFYVGYATAIIFKAPLKWPLPFSGFSNIRHFNQYQLWGLGLIYLPLFSFSLKKNMHILLNIALVFWWVLLFYSASRGVLLAWFLAILSTAIIYKKIAWPFVRTQIAHIVIGYMSYIVLFKIIPEQSNFTLVVGTIMRETTNDRIGLWSVALDLALKYPIFGVGPMQYVWHYPTNAHPHNSLLQLASEWGLPATLIIVIISVYGIHKWLTRFNKNKLISCGKSDANLTILLFFTLVANFVYSLVDAVIVMPISQVMMFITIGLMIGHYLHGNIPEISKSLFRPIIAGVVLISLAVSTLPEITQGISGSEKGFSMGYSAIGPRYWREMK